MSGKQLPYVFCLHKNKHPQSSSHTPNPLPPFIVSHAEHMFNSSAQQFNAQVQLNLRGMPQAQDLNGRICFPRRQQCQRLHPKQLGTPSRLISCWWTAGSQWQPGENMCRHRTLLTVSRITLAQSHCGHYGLMFAGHFWYDAPTLGDFRTLQLRHILQVLSFRTTWKV
jgi:hypothetical protein